MFQNLSLNLANMQIDQVNKIELYKISKVSPSSAISQWCNTFSVIKWFQTLSEKSKSKI